MATATHHRTREALPRPLIAIGVPCAGALLIALFLIRGFPYDELGVVIANRIEQSHGIHLAIGDVGPALQLAGPALEGSGTARFWLRHPALADWKEPGYPGPDLPIILGGTRPPAVSEAE